MGELLNKKVAFLSLGCKVNQYETDGMYAKLKQAGCTVVSFSKKADIYIINTCSVTNIAERKSRQMLSKARKENKEAVVVAVGCYVQNAKEEIEKKGMVDILIGNNEKNKIVSILKTYYEEQKVLDDVIDIGAVKEYETFHIKETTEHARAYVKIQDGCNQFCSYCVIPYLRGRVRSRQIEDIYEEIEQLVENGYMEVVLTGIHISSFGIDRGKGELLELIQKIHGIKGLERIRLGSLEPRIITKEFATEISKLPKVCPHFHLSLQSGCNDTLKRMNRHYTVEEFKEKCNILRQVYHAPAITTDVIVGFPGETHEEFEQTMAFLEEIHLYEIHVFKYSVRSGTKAEIMEGQVSPNIKQERSNRLLSLTKEQKQMYESQFYGSEEEVLLEERKELDGEWYGVGYTKRYVKLIFKATKEMLHTLVPVQVDEQYLQGVLSALGKIN